MKHATRLFLACLLAVWVVSCGNSATTTENGGEGDSATVGNPSGGQSAIQLEAGGLKVASLEGTVAHADAKLRLLNPPAGADLAAGKNRIEFEVKGFQLGTPTLDHANKGIANSDQGQYVALILNNEPVVPMYAAATDQTLEDGHYVILAFPSRSYHEGVKLNEGYVLRQFNVGEPENYKDLDTKVPHLFYHWPTGTLKGANETSQVLLDFYLVNCTLGPNDFKVRATINGNAFLLPKWAAYTISGLPMGENKIKLELLDATGNTVESPYNPVERTFTLQAGA